MQSSAAEAEEQEEDEHEQGEHEHEQEEDEHDAVQPTWARAAAYEAVLAAAEGEQEATRLAVAEARHTLRGYYQAAFECLTAMAHSATGDAQVGSPTVSPSPSL